MPDMLVKLYELPAENADVLRLRAEGVEIRRAIAPEKWIVAQWVREHFSEYWVSECEVAFARAPVTCLIAMDMRQHAIQSSAPRVPAGEARTNPHASMKDLPLLGFACYDTTQKGFFGPTGVAESQRGRGVGKALLVATLQAMRNDGYGYAIIGAAGPTDFYAKAVGATIIADSVPGVYRGMLRKQ